MNEQVGAQGEGNGLLWLEGYERVPQDLLDLEEDAAKATGGDWAARLATAHANIVRQTAVVFVQLLNGQLKS